MIHYRVRSTFTYFFGVLYPRTTLVDPEFNKLLTENDFLVWGGDVSDYEASQGISIVESLPKCLSDV